MKKLSIITVCLNSVDFIEKTILSVIDQTFTDYEYIIIDGLSSDGTMDIVNRYKNKIDIIISEKDSGIYSAMNKGINLATGEYTYFLNSDDYLYDDKVLETIFSKSLSADIIYGNVYMWMIYGKVGKKPLLCKPTESFTEVDSYLNNIYHQGAFIKRDLFLKYGLYDESLKVVGDYEFWLRIIFKYRVSTRYIPIAFACYGPRIGVGSPDNKDTIEIHKKEKNDVIRRYWSNDKIKLLEEIVKLRKSQAISIANEIKNNPILYKIALFLYVPIKKVYVWCKIRGFL